MKQIKLCFWINLIIKFKSSKKQPFLKERMICLILKYVPSDEGKILNKEGREYKREREKSVILKG